jgi:AraC-like DNA-binding protein/ligand-binding sensor protein
MKQEDLDFQDLLRCMVSFQAITGLGVLLCDPQGSVLFESGYHCRACKLCLCSGKDAEVCAVSRARAWRESERFGGKYIYACPMGLFCIATPVHAELDLIGHVTVGPFLMVDEEDFMQCELASRALSADQIASARAVIASLSKLAPEQVEPIAQQLFLSVSGICNTYRISDMLSRQKMTRLMGDISGFSAQEKLDSDPARQYPVALERAFLQAVSSGNRSNANVLLNDLLGHIFFLTGGDFSRIRARVLELMVLSSREAIGAGADEPMILSLCEQCIEQLQAIHDADRLCYWLTAVLKQFFDCLFQRENDVQIPLARAIAYIRRNSSQKITLEDAAEQAHLSPAYFGRIFHKQTGLAFSDYLVRLRIDNAKRLLAMPDMSIVQIAAQTGFCDQSHFTRAFKAATGLTPAVFRKKRVRGFDESKPTDAPGQ